MTKKSNHHKKAEHDSTAYLNLSRFILDGCKSNDESPMGELNTPYGIVSGPQSALKYLKALMDDDVAKALSV